jgi:uroporphyrin-III C-methyltransferase
MLLESTRATPSTSSRGTDGTAQSRGGLGRARQGTVALVGAGPGDPDLMTVRGARLLALADVVVVDALVDPRCLALCRNNTVVHDAGKLAFAPPGEGGPTQDETTALLASEARAGAFVVRLKGGDPFVFGRGGEEAIALAAAGIEVEVVPGLSSALAVPALAGIPVTHRGLATSFTVLTGTTSAAGAAIRGEPTLEERWRAAALTGGTLVFLMGTRSIERIAELVLDAGRHPYTPAAVIERGAGADQRVLTTTLERLGQDARLAHVGTPAVIVIGDVVSVRAHLGDAARAMASAKGSSDVSL